MISARSNRGRHKLVSVSIACRTPLSNSLAEVESSNYKFFTNMVVWLTGPRRHWVVLGSFIPRLYSGTLISRLFGLGILLTLTLGSRAHFFPESPDIIDDHLLRQKILQILLDVFPRPLCPLPLHFPTTDKSPWIATYTCRPYNHSSMLLLLQDAPKFSIASRIR